MIWKDIIMYCVGIIILIIGVAILVQQRVAAKPTSEVFRDSSSDSLIENEMDQSEVGVSITPTSQEQQSIEAKEDGPSEMVIT